MRPLRRLFVFSFSFPALAAVSLLLACFAVLQLIEPYYFNQDDNFSQFLPIILKGCHSLFEQGRLLDWLPEQALGLPATAVGTYALTYPPTYLAWLVANYALGAEAATLDVFFLLHAVPALLIVATFLVRRGVHQWLAVTAALAYVFCGYHLIAGRSWFYMVPPIVWTPVIVIAVWEIPVFFSRRSVSLLGVAIGISFHAGNAQMWIYEMGFATLLAVVRLRKSTSSERRTLAANLACALIIGLALAFPLLWVQLDLLSTSDRMGAGGGGIAHGLLAMLLPYPLVHANHPNGWGNFAVERAGHLFYAGTVFTLAALGAALSLCFRQSRAVGRESAIWLICAGLATLYALGWSGPLWPLVAYLPPFDKFGQPFKLLPFIHLFSTISGALALNTWLKGEPRGWKFSRGARLAASFSLALTLYHVCQCRTAFYTYADRTYRKMPPALGKALANVQRVLAHVPERSEQIGFVWSGAHNFASRYGISSIFGYDPLLYSVPPWNSETKHSPQQLVKLFGVSHIVFSFEWRDGEHLGQYGFLANSADRIYDGGSILVWRMRQPTPVVFFANDLRRLANWDASTNCIRISGLDGRSGELVVGFFWTPRWQVRTNSGRLLTYRADEAGRISIPVTAGTRAVTLTYRAPWWGGLWRAFLLLLFAGVLLRIAPRWGARKTRRPRRA